MARILVVDDEPDICEILQEMLVQAGHQVRLAPDGDGALAVLHGEPFDLIITDIFMPGKEGIETIMDIRRDFPAVKIIAMSGGGRSGELHYLKDAIELGAVRTLFKPFREEEVLRVVRAALGA